MNLHLTSQAFKENERIPSKYTCDGENISPPLRWEKAPTGTKSLVLIVDDPDAPRKTWTHWVVYNIPSECIESQEGKSPTGSLEGNGDYNVIGYKGPCPPSGLHHYHFKLYALDTKLNLEQGASKEEVEKAMNSHIIATSELIGTYSRD